MNMSYVKQIGEREWGWIYEYLNEFKDIYVCQEAHCRQCVEGVFWMARSGAQWRLLPAEYGSWNSAIPTICGLGEERHLV